MSYSIEHSAAFWRDCFGAAASVKNYHFYAYEYLDDLAFMRQAAEMLAVWPEAPEFLAAVSAKWKEIGWEGDGEIQIFWLPPFAEAGPADTFGCYVLHVKQQNDGISWFASPHLLPFHRLSPPL